ncbi:MAG: molybdopterin-binding protein [Planctomycetota bacterium]
MPRSRVAACLGAELEFHDEILRAMNDFFEKRGKTMAPKNRSQAYIPAGAAILDNPIGTAPGFRARKKGCDIVAMPGVPAEMKQMFTDHVLPFLEQSLSTARVVCRKLRCLGGSFAGNYGVWEPVNRRSPRSWAT